MAKSKYSGVLPAKKPGPPSRGGNGTPIMLRLQAGLLVLVDGYAKKQKVTRQEAVRQILVAKLG